MCSMVATKQGAELFRVKQHKDYYVVQFSAMASPCELLIETNNQALAQRIAEASVSEVKRIQDKFSRYRDDNLCSAINSANGKAVTIDDECYRLLCFAQTCYELSDGFFDLSSGILRRAWHFDGGDRIPKQTEIEQLLPLVGWDKVNFSNKQVQMSPGMELDFGGIGKEYAVSRVAEISMHLAPQISMLVNLGGDIQITQPRINQQAWVVGIESLPAHLGQSKKIHDAPKVLSIISGALATSGDTKRYLKKDGVRYSHILNPRTGWPISGAPSTITVAADLCIQAGCLATLALLKGGHAESFLTEQNVQFWCERA